MTDSPIQLLPPSFYVGAYWGQRKESLDACTERATRFLTGLSSIDPLLRSWYLLGRSRRDALRTNVGPDRATIRSLLESGRNLRDDRSAIEELGYSMNVWNGQEPSIGLSIGCGMYPQTPNLRNAVVLKIDGPVPELRELSGTTAAMALMRLLAECWQPEWATWSSSQWRREQGAKSGQPVFGWMTYLSKIREQATIPAGTWCEPFSDGFLITAGRSITEVTRQTLIAVRDAMGTPLINLRKSPMVRSRHDQTRPTKGSRGSRHAL